MTLDSLTASRSPVLQGRLLGPLQMVQEQDEERRPQIVALKDGNPIPYTSRAELWQAYKDAEAAEQMFRLRLTISPHNQMDNGNFWRILPKAYRKIAASFAGKVFLRDHCLEQEARGGTILTSKAKGAGEEAYMVQEIDVVEPWAIKGILRGTIDRFSIQLNTHDIEAYCNICGADVFQGGWCGHFPGESYDVKGKDVVCFWEVAAGTGKETSAVVDPAVPGTYIKDIQQLAASLRGPTPHSEEDHPMSIEELQATIASKEEEVQSLRAQLDEKTAGLQERETALQELQSLLAAEQQARGELQTSLDEAKQALSAAQAFQQEATQSLCETLVAQINKGRDENPELFEEVEPLTLEAELSADDVRRLRSLCLSEQVCIEKARRHIGPDFDLAAEKERLLERTPEMLAFLLEHLQKSPLPASPPPQGKGSPVSPQGGDDSRSPDPSAQQEEADPEEEEGLLTYSPQQIAQMYANARRGAC